MKTSEMSTLRVAEDISELVGETPMLHLHKMVPAGLADIYVKLEYLNPGGSIKDRAALGMILRAEREGILKTGSTILEATAGNTGVGLALIGVGRGYKVILAVPEKFSKEKAMLMEALGAVVHRTPDSEGMEGAICLVKKLRDEKLPTGPAAAGLSSSSPHAPARVPDSTADRAHETPCLRGRFLLFWALLVLTPDCHSEVNGPIRTSSALLNSRHSPWGLMHAIQPWRLDAPSCCCRFCHFRHHNSYRRQGTTAGGW